jgi:class 3 adenylate cyclase/CHASE2 domain-containing sensor protein
MSDRQKRLLAGLLAGVAASILIHFGTRIEGSGFTSQIDGYENRSYDSRMKSVASLSEEASIDDVIIIDIDDMAISPVDAGGMGRYYDWPHAHHGQLIDVVTNSLEIVWSPPVSETPPEYYQVFRQLEGDSQAEFEYMGDAFDVTHFLSGKDTWDGYNFIVVPIFPDGSNGEAYFVDSLKLITPKALLFDIIFDPENTYNYDLVNAITSSNPPTDEAIAGAAQQFLISNDPSSILRATRSSERIYHALYFENEDSLNFLYKMDSEPDGYSREDHWIKIPLEDAVKLPTRDRLGNKHVDLLSASQGNGSVDFPQDSDGLTRRAPTAIFFKGPQHVYPTIVMAAVMDILGIPHDGFDYDFENHVLRLSDTTGTVVREIPIDDHGNMFVNFYGLSKTFYYISYMYSFDPEMLPPNYWQDKVALVGTSLAGLFDLRNTPVQETFPGVEIHANVINSILKNEFVKRTDQGQNFLSILLLAILVGVISGYPKKPFWGFAVLAAGALCWMVFTYSQFMSGRIMWEVVRPTLSMVLAQLGVFSYTFLVMDKDKRFLKNTFGTYISPKLIEQMIEDKEEPKLGGDEAIHTAFFTDIQSFSAFSEEMTATDLVDLLNSYLTDMTTILLENQGTLDKYIGDAIVAFFGAPMPVKNHEYWACKTALEMQAQLKILRQQWKSEGDRWPERVHDMQNRIGIHTGSMVTGNMGSTQRMNYTMMGDTVNLAARLEASAKQYSVYIQISEDTYNAVKDRMTVRELDKVIVIGRSVPVQTYELIAEKGQEPNLYKELLPRFHDALELYKKQEWDLAITAFETAEKLEDMFSGRKTNPSRIYMDRCAHLKQNPPGNDWDGVWTLTSK